LCMTKWQKKWIRGEKGQLLIHHTVLVSCTQEYFT
jgi:hypothetical protein